MKNFKQGSATSIADSGGVRLSSTSIPAIYILLRNNSDTPISFGADSDADFHEMAVGEEYVLDAAGAERFDLMELWMKSVSADKVLNFLYR